MGKSNVLQASLHVASSVIGTPPSQSSLLPRKKDSWSSIKYNTVSETNYGQLLKAKQKLLVY